MTGIDPFQPFARREIKRRWHRLRKDATPRIADRFLEAVNETVDMLQSHPHSGTRITSRLYGDTKLRRFPVTLPFGRWLIVYSVSGDTILILRVLHGSQDWKKLFP